LKPGFLDERLYDFKPASDFVLRAGGPQEVCVWLLNERVVLQQPGGGQFVAVYEFNLPLHGFYEVYSAARFHCPDEVYDVDYSAF